MGTHLAAVAVAKDAPLEIQARPTPKPGPNDLLVAVKSVALNPADWIMRDMGIHVTTYPTVLGFDVSGLVLEVGENVPVSATGEGSGPSFQPGITRIAAYASVVWKACDPNYGIFQEQCLIPWQHAAPLPADGLSWNEAATWPVSAQVPLSVWDAIGVPRLGEGKASSKNEALLIWGASSSVGTMGVQSGRLFRDDPGSSVAAVYATAGAANHKYTASLGADRVFDYKDPQVVDAIVSAAKKDGLRIRHCFLAMGEVLKCQAVLKAFIIDAQDVQSKIGSAPPLPADLKEVEGLDTLFVAPSDNDEQRLADFQYWMGTWLRENIAKKAIKPSPKLKVVGKGVKDINNAVEVMKKGVSCTKLVVEICEGKGLGCRDQILT